jgi:hypothetical protein
MSVRLCLVRDGATDWRISIAGVIMLAPAGRIASSPFGGTI